MNYGRNMPDWQQYNTLQSGEGERPGIVQNTSHGHLFASGIGTSPLNGLNLNTDCLVKPQNEASFNLRNYPVPPPPNAPNPMAHMPSCHYGTSGGIATTIDDGRNGAGINVNNNIAALGQRIPATNNAVPNRQGSYPQCRLPCCVPDSNMGYQLGNYQSNNPYRESVHTGYPVDNRRYRGEINFRKDSFNGKDLMTGNTFPRSYPEYKHRKDSTVARNYQGQSTVLPNYPVQNYSFPDYQKYSYNMKEYQKGNAVTQRNSGMLVNMQDKFLPKQTPYQGNLMPNTNIPPTMQNPYYNSQMSEKEATETTNRMQAPLHSKHQIYQQKFAMQRYTLENHLRDLSRMPGYQTHPKYQEYLLRYKELLRLQQTVDYQSTIQGSLNAMPAPVPPINLQFDQNGVLINSSFVPGAYPGLQNPLGTIQNPIGSKDPASVQASGACVQQQQPAHCQEQFIPQSQIPMPDFQIHRTEEDNAEIPKQKGSRDFADKPELDVRQFLANWDEEEDEDGIHTVNCQNVMLSNSTPVVVLEYGNLNVESNLTNELTQKAVEITTEGVEKTKEGADKPEDAVGRTVNIIRCITSNSDEIPTIHIVDTLENDPVVKKIESALHNLTNSNIKSIEDLVNKQNLDGKEEQASMPFLTDVSTTKELTTKISDSTKEVREKTSSEKNPLATMEISNPNPDDISLPDLPTSECTPISTTLNTPNHSDNEESSERVNMNMSTNSMEIMPNSPIISFAHSPIKMDSFDHVETENLGQKGTSNELQFDFQSNAPQASKDSQETTKKQFKDQPPESQNQPAKNSDKPAESDILFYSSEELYPSSGDPPLCQISMPIVDTEEPKLQEPSMEGTNLSNIIQDTSPINDLSTVLDSDKVDDIWRDMGIDCNLDSNGASKETPEKSAKPESNESAEIATKVPNEFPEVFVKEPRPEKVKPKTNRYSIDTVFEEFWEKKKPKKRSRSVEQDRSSSGGQEQEQLLAEFRRLKRKRSIGHVPEGAEKLKMSIEDTKKPADLVKTVACFNSDPKPSEKNESRKCADPDIKIQLSNVNLRISDQNELQTADDKGREPSKDSHEGITIEINVSRVESQHSNATAISSKANQHLNISLPTNPVTCKVDCRASISREPETLTIHEIFNKFPDEEHLLRKHSVDEKKLKPTKKEKNVIAFVNRNADIDFLEDPRRHFRNASPPPTDKCLTNMTDNICPLLAIQDDKRRNDINSIKCSKPSSSSKNTEVFRNHNFSDVDQIDAAGTVDLDFDNFDVPLYNKDSNFADDLTGTSGLSDSHRNPSGFLNPLFSSIEELENLNNVPTFTTKDGKIKYSPNPKYTYRALILEARERDSRRKYIHESFKKHSHSKSRKRHSMYLHRYKHENRSKKYDEHSELSDSEWPEKYHKNKKFKEHPITEESVEAVEKTKSTCDIENETKISEDSGVESTKPNETNDSPLNNVGEQAGSEKEETLEAAVTELRTKDDAKISESVELCQKKVTDPEQRPVVTSSNLEDFPDLAGQEEIHKPVENKETSESVAEEYEDIFRPEGKVEILKPTEKEEVTKCREEKEHSKPVQEDEISSYTESQEMAKLLDDKEISKTVEEKKDISEIVEEQEISKTAEDHEMSKTTEEKDISKTVEDHEMTKPAEEQEISKPSEEQEILKPAEEQEILKPTEEQEILKPAEEQEILKPAEEQEIFKPVEEQDLSKIVEEQDISETAEEYKISNYEEEKEVPKPVEENEIIDTAVQDDGISNSMEENDISKSVGNEEISEPTVEEETSKPTVEEGLSKSMEEDVSTCFEEKEISKQVDKESVSKSLETKDVWEPSDHEKIFKEIDEQHFNEIGIDDFRQRTKSLDYDDDDIFKDSYKMLNLDNKDEDVFKQREASAIAFKNPEPPCTQIVERTTKIEEKSSMRDATTLRDHARSKSSADLKIPLGLRTACETFIEKEKEENAKENILAIKPKKSRCERPDDSTKVNSVPTTLPCSIDKSYFQHELCSRFLEQEKKYAANVDVTDRSKIVPKLVIRKSEANPKLSSKAKSFDVALEEISRREESNIRCQAHPKIPKMIIRNARSRPATPTIQGISNPISPSTLDPDSKGIKVKIKLDENGDACASNQGSESEARVPKMKIKLEDRLPRVVIKSVDQDIINHELLKTVPKMKITNVKKSPKIIDKRSSFSSGLVEAEKAIERRSPSPSCEKSLKMKIRKDISSDASRKRSGSSVSQYQSKKVKRRSKDEVRQSIECSDPNLEDAQFLSETEYKANSARKSSVKIPKVIIKRTSPSAEFKCELSKDKKDAMIRAEKWQPQVILQRSWILDCMAKDLRHMKLAVKLGTPKRPEKVCRSNDEMEWRKFIAGLKKRKNMSKSNSMSNLCPVKIKRRRRSDYNVDYSSNSTHKSSFEKANIGNKSALTDDENDCRKEKLNEPRSCWTSFDENMNSRSKVNLQNEECLKTLDGIPENDSITSDIFKDDSIKEKRTFSAMPDISPDDTVDESLLSKVVFASNSTASLDEFKLSDSSAIKVENCDDSHTMISPVSPSFSREGFNCEQLYSGDAIPTQFEFELEVISAAENALEVPLENAKDGNVIEYDKDYEASIDEHDKSSTDISMPELGVEPPPEKFDLANRVSPISNPPDLSPRKESDFAKSNTEHFSHSDLLVKEVMAAKETLKKCLRNLKYDSATKFPTRPRTAAEKKQGSSLEPCNYSRHEKVSHAHSCRKELKDYRIRNDSQSRSNSETSKSKSDKHTSRTHSRGHSRTKHHESTLQPDKPPKGNDVSALRKFRKSSHRVPEKPKVETVDAPKNDEKKIITESTQKIKAYKIPKISKTLNSPQVINEKEAKAIEDMPVLKPHLTGNSGPNSDRDTPPVLTSPEELVHPDLPKSVEEKIDRSDEDSNLQAKAKEISLSPEMTVNDIVKDLVFHNKATIKHRRYCTLCERWFPSTLRHQQHLAGYQHRHTELTQRRAIHMLFLLFTGKLCPRLLPPNITRTDCVLGELTPLQVAVQDFAMVFDGMRESLSRKESEESKK